MKSYALAKFVLRMGTPLLSAAFLGSALSPAQAVKPVITLDPQPGGSGAMASYVKGEATFANAPANFRSFRSVKAGELGDAEPLTLRFSETTKLTKIEATKDFRVEQGSSCVEGNVYEKGGSCNLLVRFTPQGPGHRLGKLTIAHTASVTPMYVGLGGNGYAPVLSFTPAQISTVPASYPGSVGLLNGASYLAVDGGDTLYIADTGNNLVRSMDSNNKFLTLASGYTSPNGIAVDTMGEVYFDTVSTNNMYEIYDYGPVVEIAGTTTGSCPAATPCALSSHALSLPGAMSTDSYNNLFFADGDLGAALATVQPTPADLIYLYDPFPYETNPPSPIVVDNYDNIYSFWSIGGTCSIMQASLYNAENNKTQYNKVAGGHTCGFAGDGGQARNAEVGAVVSQMAFDVAGNLYFTDSSNQRVRRIDASTGIISTIAGNGTAGYGGDGGPGTAATLSSPTGVGVDSQGQVYIISKTTTSGTAQVVRKLGTNGIINFGNQLKGVSIGPNMLTLANTGNSALTITSAVIRGTNASDFTIDPTSTSCLLTPGSTLANGQSCKVGILFKPGATGYRSATIAFLDNTVSNTNTVVLEGSGILPTPTIAITAPAAGSSYASGTSIKFTATVTSSTSPAPTGTVKFTLDGTVINSGVTLSSGSASLNATVSSVGSHTLGVSYSGDANYAATPTVTRTFTVTASAVKSGPVKPVLPHQPVKVLSGGSQ